MAENCQLETKTRQDIECHDCCGSVTTGMSRSFRQLRFDSRISVVFLAMRPFVFQG